MGTFPVIGSMGVNRRLIMQVVGRAVLSPGGVIVRSTPYGEGPLKLAEPQLLCLATSMKLGEHYQNAKTSRTWMDVVRSAECGVTSDATLEFSVLPIFTLSLLHRLLSVAHCFWSSEPSAHAGPHNGFA